MSLVQLYGKGKRKQKENTEARPDMMEDVRFASSTVDGTQPAQQRPILVPQGPRVNLVMGGALGARGGVPSGYIPSTGGQTGGSGSLGRILNADNEGSQTAGAYFVSNTQGRETKLLRNMDIWMHGSGGNTRVSILSKFTKRANSRISGFLEIFRSNPVASAGYSVGLRQEIFPVPLAHPK